MMEFINIRDPKLNSLRLQALGYLSDEDIEFSDEPEYKTKQALKTRIMHFGWNAGSQKMERAMSLKAVFGLDSDAKHLGIDIADGALIERANDKKPQGLTGIVLTSDVETVVQMTPELYARLCNRCGYDMRVRIPAHIRDAFPANTNKVGEGV